jgi:dTDP-4-amino-4,6-dideoxygalactose transaminase
MNFYIGRPNIPDTDVFLHRVKDVLESRRLSNHGPAVKELESRLADFLGVKHVVTVCNATIGLMAVVKVLELDGEVILPSFTFIASAHALQFCGIKPVFCDINPNTHNIDPTKLEALITNKTTAIMGVHVWGRACPHDELSAIARKHKLKLIYDAAHAFKTTHKSRPIAALEDISVLSFHATKCFNTFEGGAIVTNDDELARKSRLMCNYSFYGEDNVTGLGINGKMSEIHAAMGLCELEDYPNVLAHNKMIYECYKDMLSMINGISLIDYPLTEENNYHYIVVEIDNKKFGQSRDEIHGRLKEAGIIARRYFNPGCHRSEPYKSLYPDTHLPHTDSLCERVLLLPGGSGIDDVGQVDEIMGVISPQNT